MFRHELENIANTGNIYAVGVLKRHAVMFFKFCAVLTAFRMYQLGNMDTTIECLDKDFEIAKYFISISLDSSLEVLEQLPATRVPIKRKDKTLQFESSLPASFTRAFAVKASKDLKISSRTVDRWLEKLVLDGKIKQQEHGHYEKC
jgi:hypothetical protein